jgi:hypothetical protein
MAIILQPCPAGVAVIVAVVVAMIVAVVVIADDGNDCKAAGSGHGAKGQQQHGPGQHSQRRTGGNVDRDAYPLGRVQVSRQFRLEHRSLAKRWSIQLLVCLLA